MASNTYIHGPAKGHKHTHTIIFLHGRDSNAAEFDSELFESEGSAKNGQQDQDLTIPALSPSVRWVFPQAPMLHSKRFDTEMSQWFDMWSVENPDEQSELQHDGLSQSIEKILDVIHSEEKMVPRDHIFLGGISQGFATVLATLFAEGQGGFAGIIGLSGWMIYSDKVEAEIARSSQDDDEPLFLALQSLYGKKNGKAVPEQALPAKIKETPIFLAHALDDDVVPVENGNRMKRDLCTMGLSVEWHAYSDGGHWVNEPEGVDDIFSFF